MDETIKPGRRKPATGVDLLHSILERLDQVEAQAHTQHTFTLSPEAIEQIATMVSERLHQRMRHQQGRFF